MRNSDQAFAGVMLIGIAVLWLTSYWFPGIFFVIAAALLAKVYAEGKTWQHADARGAIILIILGLIFATNLLSLFSGALLPLVIIALGLFLLFGDRLGLSNKRK